MGQTVHTVPVDDLVDHDHSECPPAVAPSPALTTGRSELELAEDVALRRWCLGVDLLQVDVDLS
jgi:hypothetical protein